MAILSHRGFYSLTAGVRRGVGQGALYVLPERSVTLIILVYPVLATPAKRC